LTTLSCILSPSLSAPKAKENPPTLLPQKKKKKSSIKTFLLQAMLRREPFLCKLIFFLFCFASLSLADELTDSDRLEFTANASISNTSLPKPNEGGSFADMIDKALEKEFTENDQNEGSFS
jgi:hypothetical protein